MKQFQEVLQVKEIEDFLTVIEEAKQGIAKLEKNFIDGKIFLKHQLDFHVQTFLLLADKNQVVAVVKERIDTLVKEGKIKMNKD